MRLSTLQVYIEAEGGQPPVPLSEHLVAQARQGMATEASVQVVADALAVLAARVQTVEAGQNISIVQTQQGQLVISAVGGVASYRDVTGDGSLEPDDNGKVVAVDSAAPVVLAVPAGLPRGWTCLVRQVGAGAVTVGRGPGVVFAPVDGNLATAATWQEIALESQGGDVVLARLLG